MKYPAATADTEAEVDYSVAIADVAMVKAKAEVEYPVAMAEAAMVEAKDSAAMTEAEAKYPAAMSASRHRVERSRPSWGDGERKLLHVHFFYVFPC